MSENLQDADLLKYARQLTLKQVGFSGQQRLIDSHVVIIGAGGLGGQVALQLAAMGVGSMVVIDYDEVDLSNLSRQIQFSTEDLDRPKVNQLAMRCQAINPQMAVQTFKGTFIAWQQGLSNQLSNRLSHPLAKPIDLLLDCSDNFACRYQVANFARQDSLPLMSSAVSGFDSQHILLPHTSTSSPCYSCLFPPETQQALNDTTDHCHAAGVTASSVGIAGSMQAQFALLFLLGKQPVCEDTLLLVQGLSMQVKKMKVPKDSSCPWCGSGTIQGE